MLAQRLVLHTLTFLWIFSIPTSIAIHWNSDAGLVNGVLVDYRIPTLAISSVLLLMTAIVFVFLKVNKQRLENQLNKTVIYGLFFSLFFQISLALYQYHFQRSLFGYLPFGEVNINSSQIAKGIIAGRLYTLPYGTTVHPNILSGFVVITSLLLFYQRSLSIDGKFKLAIFSFTILVCILTQSATALGALILGTIPLLVRVNTKALRLTILLIPLFSVLLFSLPQMKRNNEPSIARRAQLQSIAVAMIKSSPFTGVGWNNFTYLQEKYEYIPATVRFLQPPHNVFVILITELGILGWILNFAILRTLWKMKRNYLPIAGALVLIGSYDHYLLTLTTGRMLLVLFAIRCLERRNPETEV